MRELTDSSSSLRIFSPLPSEPTELGDRTRPGSAVTLLEQTQALESEQVLSRRG